MINKAGVRTAALGRKQRFKLRHYRKAPRWHRDELGAERKAARRKCSKSVSTDSKVFAARLAECLAPGYAIAERGRGLIADGKQEAGRLLL
jgi:hypothetical protein